MTKDVIFDESRNFKGIWIPASLYKNKELSWNEKILLLEIDSLSKNGICYANNQHFANMLGVSKRQVERLLESLKQANYITSVLIYKKDSKVIERRILKVNDPETYTNLDPSKKMSVGGDKNVDTPPDKNGGDNYNNYKNTKKIESRNRSLSKKENRDSNEISFDIFVRQLHKLCDDNYSKADIETYINIFGYYFHKYSEFTGEKHPRLKDDNIMHLIEKIDEGIGDTDCRDFDTYKPIIDKHFEKEYGIPIDWNINHFMSGNIRMLLYYETCY